MTSTAEDLQAAADDLVTEAYNPAMMGGRGMGGMQGGMGGMQGGMGGMQGGMGGMGGQYGAMGGN